MQQLLTLSYWFARVPAPMSTEIKYGLLILFALMFAVGVLLRFVFVKKFKEKATRKKVRALGRMFGALGFVGLGMLFLAMQRIPVFGSRYWFIVYLLIFCAWLGFLIYKFRKTPNAQ